MDALQVRLTPAQLAAAAQLLAATEAVTEVTPAQLAAAAQLAAETEAAETTETAPPPTSVAPTSSNTTHGKFPCTACNAMLTTKGNLKKHLECNCPNTKRTQEAKAKIDKANVKVSAINKNRRKTDKAWKADEGERAAATREKQRVDKEIGARRANSSLPSVVTWFPVPRKAHGII